MRAKLKPVLRNVDQSILVKNDKLKTFYAPHHYHPEYEIIYIKKSQGIRIVGNHIDNYKAGEIIILGPGLPHYHVLGMINDHDDNPIETIAVLFPESILTANMDMPEFAPIKRILSPLKFGIELTGSTLTTVQAVLEKMTIAPRFNNFVYLLHIFGIIAEQDSTFQRLSTVEYQNKKTYNDKTKHILDYLAGHYLEPLTIDGMAQLSGLSKTGFCNFFKTQTGITFSFYLNSLRIAKACELLITTPMNISQIAYETGFQNLAYFNRRFKQIRGTSPSDYRKKTGSAN
jgi:AraC-like DNA-binding protein